MQVPIFRILLGFSSSARRSGCTLEKYEQIIVVVYTIVRIILRYFVAREGVGIREAC